jgi:hypothetical protein
LGGRTGFPDPLARRATCWRGMTHLAMVLVVVPFSQ